MRSKKLNSKKQPRFIIAAIAIRPKSFSRPNLDREAAKLTLWNNLQCISPVKCWARKPPIRPLKLHSKFVHA